MFMLILNRVHYIFLSMVKRKNMYLIPIHVHMCSHTYICKNILSFYREMITVHTQGYYSWTYILRHYVTNII